MRTTSEGTRGANGHRSLPEPRLAATVELRPAGREPHVAAGGQLLESVLKMRRSCLPYRRRGRQVQFRRYQESRLAGSSLLSVPAVSGEVPGPGDAGELAHRFQTRCVAGLRSGVTMIDPSR